VVALVVPAESPEQIVRINGSYVILKCTVWEAVGTRTKLVRLFNETRRRRVLKVVAGYVVACWGIIQVSEMFADNFGLPGHPIRWLFVIAFAGLPIAFALGWKYDLTPEGMRPAGTAGADDAVGSTPALPIAEGQVAAVAVLPFDNLTPNTARAYLANAIPIELQSLLSRMHDLRVVSRQSAVARSESRADLRTIARDLAVQYVISGSVADLGERLQINVQLADARDDTLLWSERYDVAAEDVERLQQRISEAVVATFGGERMRAEIGRANRAANTDPTAWQLVQQARSYLLDYTPASIASAIPLLRRAIELDSNYAIAYATLGLVTAEKTLNALSANPDADRRSALDAIARAERLAPRDAVVLRTAGCIHAYVGAYARSLEILRRAVKLAPYDLGTWGYLGWPLVATGRAEDRRELHEIVDRLLATSGQHPGHAYWVFHKSVALTCDGELELALKHAQAYTIEQPRFSLGWLHYVNVLGRLDRAAEARAALEQSLATNPLMTPAYYAGLMAVLSDQPSVIDSRTAGLKQAGLL
jgi:adenylate cyclase